MGLTERADPRPASRCRSRVPIIIGGFRTATLQVIATATIGAILSVGGLGRFIIDGLANRDDAMLFGGRRPRDRARADRGRRCWPSSSAS